MRILIVEDSDLVHAALLEALGECPGADVIGRATSECGAISAILEGRPDVVLLDLALSPGSGLDVLHRVRAHGCQARILVVSNQASDAMRRHCIEAGADGFFDKCTELGQLLAHLGTAKPAGPVTCDAVMGAAVAGAHGAGRHVLDAIVARAQALTGCPMAAISLMGSNRQWFLAQAGLALTGTSRHIAFCLHTLAAGGLLEVRDTARDPRFAANPLTAAPFGVRHYAGTPLVLSSGCAVGALCVLDTDPRALAPGQRESLRLLAEEAANHIERICREAHEECARCDAPWRAEPGTDALTGLPDAATLEAAYRVDTAGSPSGGLLLVGLDRLGAINLTLGRAAGDAVLRESGRRLQVPAGVGAHVGRLGGDVFGVVLRDIRHEAELLAAGEAIVEAIGRPLSIEGRVVRAQCSVGMALASDGAPYEVLVARAHMAMRQAKKLGGALCQFHAGWMDVQIALRPPEGVSPTSATIAARVEGALATSLPARPVTVP